MTTRKLNIQPKTLLSLILLALVTATIIASIIRLEILVVNTANGVSVFRAPIEIIVEYIHSVEGSRVVEVLEARGECIILAKLTWQGHGAGMPSSITDIPQSRVKIVGNMYEASIGRCLGSSITLNLNYMVDGRLMIGDNIISQGVVEIKLVEWSLLEVLCFYLEVSFKTITG